MEPLIESVTRSVTRIEPAHPELTSDIANVIADISAQAATLGRALNPITAASLADLVRLMNSYYSNLIEGRKTRPRDIERALAGQLESDEGRRNLQVEAAAHVRVQVDIDRLAAEHQLANPAAGEFILHLHREFYRDAPEAMLKIKGATRETEMVPGEWRSQPEHDVSVGRHHPPSSSRVPDFMKHFEKRYSVGNEGTAQRIAAIAAAHHRFNYIHPFPDGNGRVSRLMSHAMAYKAGIGAHGLWSISRGLARGLESRGEYKRMMDHADMPRQGDRDGRGNLSERALNEFTLWFLRVCLDQLVFMQKMFDMNGLQERFRSYVSRSPELKPEAARLLEAALFRGEFERGAAASITNLPERTARRILSSLEDFGLLASTHPKKPVALRFPAAQADWLFPQLFPLA